MTVDRSFEDSTKILPLKDLLPLRYLGPAQQESIKFLQIQESLRHIGLVEPIVVARTDDPKKYVILDGHWRVRALRDLKIDEVECLISTSQEGYTYNTHVNRLTPVQEHLMVKTAIEKGLSEKRVAEVLNLHPRSIRSRIELLTGIEPAVAKILRDKPVPKGSFELIKKAKKARQIEMAELMVVAQNYSRPYAAALLAATTPSALHKRSAKFVADDLPATDKRRMGREIQKIKDKVIVAQQEYGNEVIKQTALKAYLKRLMGNKAVITFIAQNNLDLIANFKETLDAQ